MHTSGCQRLSGERWQPRARETGWRWTGTSGRVGSDEATATTRASFPAFHTLAFAVVAGAGPDPHTTTTLAPHFTDATRARPVAPCCLDRRACMLGSNWP